MLSQETLWRIEDAAEFIFYPTRYGIARVLDRDRIQIERMEAEERRKLLRRTRALKKQGILTYTRHEKSVEIRFLAPASLVYLEKLIQHNKNMLPSGTSLFLAYDIPESHKRSRQKLRELLKRSGFEQCQKSLWRTERDVADALRAWIKKEKLPAKSIQCFLVIS